MPHNNEHKIDPRLRRDAELGCVPADTDDSGYTCWVDPASRQPRPTPPNAADENSKRDRYAQVFIEVADPGATEWLKGQRGVTQFVNIVDGYCTAVVRLDLLEALADRKDIMEVEALRFYQAQLDHSVDSIRGWSGLSHDDRLMQGSGAVIGIVDYGLDFTLRDFRKPEDGRTRVAYLWDQQLQPQGRERPPDKYNYGVEYSSDEINRALETENPFTVVRHNPLNTEEAVSGHGTHVAGIAAGNGFTSDRQDPAGKYVGVAPGATLVFVHLNRNIMRRQVNAPRGTLANSVNLAHAIAYCFEKADKLKMPCVVNLSMGFNGGGHDGNMAVEWIIDSLLQKSGRAVVIAAGNENRSEKRIYLRDSVRKNQRASIGWENGFMLPAGRGIVAQRDPSPNEMEIWYSSQSQLAVRLIAPRADQASEWVQPGHALTPFRFDGGEDAIITSDQRTPWDGAARIYIQLSAEARGKGIRAGTWVVELEATSVGQDEARDGVRYDAWIERTIPEGAPRYMRSRFKDFSPTTAITVTTPGTAKRAITVASCNSSDPPEISEFSGRGPTRDGRTKPEIAAPGGAITSTNAGAGRGNPAAPAHRQLQGTSMAAPHVTGVIARLLSRQPYLSWNEIRDILVNTAVHPAGHAGLWDPSWGYGKLDAEAAMQDLEDKLR